jgi:hypothetical protein
MALTKVKAGNILLTTPGASSNDVTPATTAYVTTALANLADSAPETLNTLNELAAALGDDANFSTTVTNSIAAKLPLAGGTMTGDLNLAVTDKVDFGGGIGEYASSPAAGIVGFTSRGSVGLFTDSNNNGSATGDALVVYDGAEYGGSTKTLLKVTKGNDISFYEDTGTTPKLFWDASAECLSIGVIGTETDRRFQISATSPSTATTQYGIVANPTMSNDVTGSVYNIYSQANVASGTTLTNLYNLYLGATGLSGSTITNNYGLYQAGASEKNYFAGNVGIGTTSPLAKNQITGSGTSGQVTASWILQNTSSGTAGMDIIGAAGASRLRFVYGGGPGTGTNSLTEAMCIGTEGTYAGNVGIGTDNPAFKLVVAHNSRNGIEFVPNTDDAGTNIIQNYNRGTAAYTPLRIAGNSLTLLSGTNAQHSTSIDTSGNVSIGATNKLYLDGGGDTYINEYSANEIGFWTGGVRRVSISAGNLYMTGSGGIFAGGTSGGGYNLGTTTSYGSYGCGPQNSSYMHHTTDRPTYYWDKPCTASGGFSTYSDERLKENITTIDSALDKVALMNGVTFNWIDSDTRGGGNTGKQFGVLAQNMLEVDSELPTLNDDPLSPEETRETDDSYYTMDYTRITPFLIEAIKELKTKLEAAEARIATLEG